MCEYISAVLCAQCVFVWCVYMFTACGCEGSTCVGYVHMYVCSGSLCSVCMVCVFLWCFVYSMYWTWGVSKLAMCECGMNVSLLCVVVACMYVCV